MFTACTNTSYTVSTRTACLQSKVQHCLADLM